MKRAVLALALLFPIFALAQGQRIGQATQVSNGFVKTLPGATITVCPYSSTLICLGVVSIYKNPSLTLPLTNPFFADADGNFFYFAASGNYLEKVSSAGTVATTIPITIGGTGGGGTPGGTSGQAQYNNSGAFGGFTLSGDATLNTSTGSLTLATVNSNVGSCGDGTHVCQVTLNAKGQTTAATAVAITNSGAGTVVPSTQYEIPFYSNIGTDNTLTGAAGVSVDSSAQTTITATGGYIAGTGAAGVCNGLNGCFAGAQTGTLASPTAGVNVLQANSNGSWSQILGAGTPVPVPNSVAAPMTLGSTGLITTPLFVASGSSHASGLVPDPGSSAGTTRFLREDSTWAVPPGAGGSATANQAVSFTGQTSVSIPAATSGATSPNILVQCYDTASPAHLIVPASVTVNGSTFAVTVTFNSSTSGYCATNISGPALYTASLSSGTTWTISHTTHGLGAHIAAVSLIDSNGNQIIPGKVAINGSGDITITNNYTAAFTVTVTN